MWSLSAVLDSSVLEPRKPVLCSLTPCPTGPSTTCIITKIILAQNILFGEVRVPLDVPGYFYTHSSLLLSTTASSFCFVSFSRTVCLEIYAH